MEPNKTAGEFGARWPATVGLAHAAPARRRVKSDAVKEISHCNWIKDPGLVAGPFHFRCHA